MAEHQRKRNLGTRYLSRHVPVEPMPPRHTDKLDLDLPQGLRLVLDDLSGVFEVPLLSYMVIGRKNNAQDTQVDIDLAPFRAHEMGVSRYHAIITAHDDRISIKDFNSTNGTLLNGYALQPMHSYRLRHGDALVFGELRLSVQFIGGKYD